MKKLLVLSKTKTSRDDQSKNFVSKIISCRDIEISSLVNLVHFGACYFCTAKIQQRMTTIETHARR